MKNKSTAELKDKLRGCGYYLQLRKIYNWVNQKDITVKQFAELISYIQGDH